MKMELEGGVTTVDASPEMLRKQGLRISFISTCRTYPSPPWRRRRRRGVLERVLLLPPLDQRQVAK